MLDFIRAVAALPPHSPPHFPPHSLRRPPPPGLHCMLDLHRKIQGRKISEDTSDRMPGFMPDRMPEYLPEDMSGRMPKRMLGYMPDRMAELLPEYI